MRPSHVRPARRGRWSRHTSGPQDRVGLLSWGRTVAWVPPLTGRRARLLLMDELLSVGGAEQDPLRRRLEGGRVAIPSDAMVVGVTGLRSRYFVQGLMRYRHAGHTVAALVVDIADLLPPPKTRADEAALRVWLAQRDAERFALDRRGVATAVVSESPGVGPAISTLRRKMSTLHRGGIGTLAG